MRKLATIPAVFMTALLAFGCDSDETGPAEALVGDFEATSAVFTQTANPLVRMDVVDRQGTLRVNLQDDGNFQSELVLPDRPALQRAGTFDFDADASQITFTEDGVSRTVPVEVEPNGNVFTIFDENERFDFEGTGETSRASLQATFERVR